MKIAKFNLLLIIIIVDLDNYNIGLNVEKKKQKMQTVNDVRIWTRISKK